MNEGGAGKSFPFMILVRKRKKRYVRTISKTRVSPKDKKYIVLLALCPTTTIQITPVDKQAYKLKCFQVASKTKNNNYNGFN